VLQYLISYNRNLLFVFFLLTSSALAKVGEVSFQSQSAQIVRGNEKILTNVGTSVEMYDEIETLDGVVKILFVDDTKVTIAEYSTLVVDEFVYDNNTKKGKVNLKASFGTLRYTSGLIAKNNRENIKITTPTASVSVRGTDFEVIVKESGESKFTLLPSEDSNGKQYVGSIEVFNNIGSVILTEAFEVTSVTSTFTSPSRPVIDNNRKNETVKIENELTENVDDEKMENDNQDDFLEEASYIDFGGEETDSIFEIEDDKATFTSDNENKIKLIVPSVSDVSLNYNNNGTVTEGVLNAGGSVSINIIQQ
tara:strand:- start:312 stop:1235 length:924 start_codon:yes stop_codon:yes gene_type:complete